MSVCISLLRAINLPGHNRMKISKLEAAPRSLGCEEVETYLQNGSVIFRAPKLQAKLAETIEAKIRSAFVFSEMGWPGAEPAP